MTGTLAGIGEFGLIDRIRRLLGQGGAAAEGLAAGPGDDAAVISPRPGFQLLATCDSMVEGRHFIPGTLSPRELGRRAMVMNLSDIAAMGGEPRFALASLGLRPETTLEEVDEIYLGFLHELNPLGAVLAGGNITKSGNGVFLDITVLGEVPCGKAVLRSGARPGDIILVSGFPGEAAAGLGLLRSGGPYSPGTEPLLRAYRTPCHRVREGRAIGGSGLATAMIDTSDGFTGDLAHICEESGVGAELLEASLPVSDALLSGARLLGGSVTDYVLGESDDYELIVTCRPGDRKALEEAMRSAGKTLLTRVGSITERPGRIELVRADRSRSEIRRPGWDHFAGPGPATDER